MRLFETTGKYVRRSPYQAMAAILTMFLMILISGVFFLISVAAAVTIQHFESKPQITVFFTDSASTQVVSTLQSALEDTGKVASVKFVSKEEALTLYREQNKNDPLLLEMVSADILPASLEVSATDPKYLQEFIPLIEGTEGIEEVVYQKDVVDALLSWTYAIRLVGAVLAGLLALDSILIITTIVGMKIAMRREEVEILKLVGASPWYIRAPFIMEGGFYGLVGAFMAWAVITGVVVWMQPFLLSFLGIISTISSVLASTVEPSFILWTLAFGAGLLFIGFFLGSLGSLFAVGRYLKL